MSFVRERRRYEDDEEAPAQRRPRFDGGGGGGGGYVDHADMERRLQDLIVRVGDAGGASSMESNLESLCAVLEADLDQYRTKIIEIITSCVVYMPHKLTIYSTLVGLLNAKHYNFGGEVVEKLCSDLQSFLEAENFAFSLYISIFLCDLGNCRVLSLNSIVEFLEGYIEAAFEENVPQVRTDWFTYAVLHSLPWIGGELADKKSSELDNIMEGLGKYLEQRRREHVKLLHVWSGQMQHNQEEYLDSLWAQIKTLKEAGWKERFIQRYYVGFDSLLQDALQHNLPTFVPPVHSERSTYPNPWVVFRLFDYTDCPDDGPVLPGAHSIERFLVEEEITWTIDQHSLDRKAWWDSNLEFSVLDDFDSAPGKKSAAELLRYSKRAMIPLPYCILEVIFAQLFRLPEPPYNPLFYGALLIELCKLLPESFPQVLAQAAELLYQRADTMQPICLDRFVDWFSYHLSNFQYRWSWSDWNDCLELAELNHRKIFAREVLERCIRFAYYDKIKELVPPSFEKILPPPPEICYTLDDPENPEHECARVFMQLFQEKSTAEKILPELLKEGSTTEYDDQTFSSFLTVMFKLACKSFSHNFSALMRYHKLLKTVCDSSEEMQGILLRTLYDCWKNNSQYIVILIDKFLKAQIIDCGVLVAWIFSREMKHEQHRQWPWEVLNSALEKLCRHVNKMRKDLREREEEAARTQDGGGDAQMEDDQLATMRVDFENIVDFQKNLFLDVLHIVNRCFKIRNACFQKFSVSLTEHVLNAERDSTDFRTPWFEWMTGRFRQVFLKHNRDLWRINADLTESLFSRKEIDPTVVDVYQQFVALRT